MANATTYDSRVANWISRVETADGATLPTAYKDAVNALILTLDEQASPNAGVSNLAALKQLIIPAGPATMAGCMVPFLSSMPAATAVGTAGGWDIIRAQGIRGNGTNNYINLGLGVSAVTVTNRSHGGWFALDNTGGTRIMITNRDANNSGSIYYDQLNTTQVRSVNNGASVAVTTPTPSTGLYGSVRLSTAQQIFKVPGSAATAYTDASPATDSSAANYQALAAGLRNTAYSRHRGGVIYVGNAISQDAFNAAVTAFMSAISTITF
jgi:hypothetical protein